VAAPLDFPRTCLENVMYVCFAGCRRMCEILGTILKFVSNNSIRDLKFCARLFYRTVLTNMTTVLIFVVTFGE
jgi:hypothetical protein